MQKMMILQNTREIKLKSKVILMKMMPKNINSNNISIIINNINFSKKKKNQNNLKKINHSKFYKKNSQQINYKTKDQ